MCIVLNHSQEYLYNGETDRQTDTDRHTQGETEFFFCGYVLVVVFFLRDWLMKFYTNWQVQNVYDRLAVWELGRS